MSVYIHWRIGTVKVGEVSFQEGSACVQSWAVSSIGLVRIKNDGYWMSIDPWQTKKSDGLQ